MMHMTYADSPATYRPKKLKSYSAPNYLDMLAYCRPEGSRYQKKFCRRFLEPVFGKPDLHGNYSLIIGDKPKVAFMSHHDTVHHKDARQSVRIDGDFARTDGNDVLGADCTTGIYIMLRMIEANVAGVYVIHAAEEVGCVGSAALVKDFPSWINHVDFAISFDRMGYSSVITHQTSMRTCSEEFANSLIDILDLGYKTDDTGVYTDSNEYTDFIAECTNISVGYFKQHTKNENQDLVFLETLINQLVVADWSKLVKARVPGQRVYDASYFRSNYKYTGRAVNSMDYYDDPWDDFYTAGRFAEDRAGSGNDIKDMMSVIKRYPEQVAILLESYGYNYDGLLDDCEQLKEKQQRRFRSIS